MTTGPAERLIITCPPGSTCGLGHGPEPLRAAPDGRGRVSRGGPARPGNVDPVIWDSRRIIVPSRAQGTGESGLRRRLPGRREDSPRRNSRVIRLVAILAVGALVLSQCGGEDEESTDGVEESTPTSTDATTGAAEASATTVFAAPPAPDPLPPPEPPAAPQPAAPQPAAPTPPPSPAPSGPPPVTVGVMSDMAVAADGYAHARFVAEFFGGPIDDYSAVSSDNGVATAGVSPPNMLIVAPVSNGTASITVTAFGPGGTATQTFVARVGAGATQVNRSTVPQPSPPPPAPAPPPARQEPAAEESDVMVPTEELPPRPPAAEPDTSTDAIPTESLPPIRATAAPTLSGAVPEQTINVGQTVTVDVTSHFAGIVQGWAVESSNSTSVEASMTVAGRVTVRGLAAGTSTVTVTAVNDIGSVAQAFRVTVGAGSGTTTTTAAGTTTTTTAAAGTTTTTTAAAGTTTTTTAAAGTTTTTTAATTIETVAGPLDFTVAVGRSIRVDLSELFSGEATGFNVTYDASGSGGRVDVTVRGSEATIRGVQAGKIVITIAATRSSQRVTQLATVEVTAI